MRAHAVEVAAIDDDAHHLELGRDLLGDHARGDGLVSELIAEAEQAAEAVVLPAERAEAAELLAVARVLTGEALALGLGVHEIDVLLERAADGAGRLRGEPLDGRREPEHEGVDRAYLGGIAEAGLEDQERNHEQHDADGRVPQPS